MVQKQIYKNPKAGQPLLTTISTGCRTPLLNVKFCNLVNPFRYPNSPTIPRYSVTCVICPSEHKEFIKGIQSIESDEKVDSILKNETAKEGASHVHTGNFLIKFQTKEVIPIYVIETENAEPEAIVLEDELAAGEQLVVVYDILRYTKRNTSETEHGLSFKPTALYYYPKAS